jgi:hypothetical protein
MIQQTAGRILGGGAGGISTLAGRLEDGARVLRFLKGLLELEVRPDDIFIVTYPRSGTTWLQYILHLLTSGEEAGFEHISQVAPWFERSLAVGALTAADLESMPSPRIFKSHLARCWVPPGARYIYVARDGRDVACSYYHFYRSHLRYTGSFEAFLRRFLAGDLQYGSWFKHTRAWSAHRGDPALLYLRYEELRRSPREGIATIAAFCGIDVDEARVARVAELSSFERMKREEARFDFTTELLLQRGYRLGAFLRRGQTGEGREGLTPEQEDAFRRAARARFTGLELDLPRFLR